MRRASGWVACTILTIGFSSCERPTSPKVVKVHLRSSTSRVEGFEWPAWSTGSNAGNPTTLGHITEPCTIEVYLPTGRQISLRGSGAVLRADDGIVYAVHVWSSDTKGTYEDCITLLTELATELGIAEDEELKRRIEILTSGPPEPAGIRRAYNADSRISADYLVSFEVKDLEANGPSWVLSTSVYYSPQRDE